MLLFEHTLLLESARFDQCRNRFSTLLYSAARPDAPRETSGEVRTTSGRTPPCGLCNGVPERPRDVLKRPWCINHLCRELKWALLSAAQPKSAHRGHRTRHARPPAPRSLPRRPPVIFLSTAVPRRDSFTQSQRRQLNSAKTNTTTLMFPLKSHVVITTDTDPIDSQARGVGWVAWCALALRERARLG